MNQGRTDTLTRRTFITALAGIPLLGTLAWKERLADTRRCTLYKLNPQHPLAKGLVFASFGTQGQYIKPPEMVIATTRIFC